MALDNEQIVRQAYRIAEDKDLKGWVEGSSPQQPVIWARGLTSVTSIAFDRQGRHGLRVQLR
jgi:hypothetical protein